MVSEIEYTHEPSGSVVMFDVVGEDDEYYEVQVTETHLEDDRLEANYPVGREVRIKKSVLEEDSAFEAV